MFQVLQQGHRSELAQLAAKVARDSGIAVLGTYLMGSFAEGFANPRSDLDVLVVFAGDRAVPRHVTRFADHRTEVYFRSRAAIEAERAAVRQHSEQLDFLQRLRNALPLDEGAGDWARRVVPPELDAWIAEHFSACTRTHALRALALHARGARFAAVERAHYSAVHAAKAWCARAGDAYMPLKWVALQLARCAAPEVLQHELARFLADGSALCDDGSAFRALISGFDPSAVAALVESDSELEPSEARHDTEPRRRHLLASKAIEVQLEDANGALLAGQWPAVQWSLRAAAGSCARLLIEHAEPRAPDEVAVMHAGASGPAQLRAAIERLRRIVIEDLESARAGVSTAIELAGRAREVAGITDYPLASESLDAWNFYDRLAANEETA